LTATAKTLILLPAKYHILQVLYVETSARLLSQTTAKLTSLKVVFFTHHSQLPRNNGIDAVKPKPRNSTFNHNKPKQP